MAATKFLDNTGLAYLWSKIKAWANAAFAAISHSHGNITNDGKLGTASRVAITDSNKKITVSSVTSTELGYVSGVTSAIQTQLNGKAASSHNQSSNTINVMTGYSKPSSGNAIAVSDSLNTAIGKLEYKIDSVDVSNYAVINHTHSYLPLSGGTMTGNIVYNETNGNNSHNCLLTLNSTSLNFGLWDTTNNKWILWATYDGKNTFNGNAATATALVDDSNYVHKTGNETVAGIKTFSNDVVLNASSPDILFYNSTLTKGTNPSETMWNEVLFCDKTGNRDAAYRLGQLAVTVDTSGKTSIGLYAYNWASGSTTQSSIGISYPKNGTPYTWAPTPDTSDNSAKMATTAFVKAQGYLTSHQSLASCVKTSGAQTIGGIKTFTASPEIKRDNPYIYFIETDQTRWTSANSAYQGLFFCDKNTTEMAGLLALNYANHCALRLYTYSKGTSFGNTYLELSGADSGSVAKNFSPYPTKGCSLGNSSHLYTQLYANTATISTSDEKDKSNIESIPDEVLDAWEEVSFCSFQFNDALAQKGAAARIHSGLVSQRVHEIFGRHGFDGFRYAFLCRDQGEAVDRDEKQPDGTIHHFHEDAYDNWGIRYEEALCIEAAYQRRKNKILENRISELEKRLAKLEGTV